MDIEKRRQEAEERRRQAKIILEVMAEDVINMNWNDEEDYLKAIEKGLKRAEDERSQTNANREADKKQAL